MCWETNSSTAYFNRTTYPRIKGHRTLQVLFFDQRQITWYTRDFGTSLPCLDKVGIQLLHVKGCLNQIKPPYCTLQIMVRAQQDVVCSLEPAQEIIQLTSLKGINISYTTHGIKTFLSFHSREDAGITLQAVEAETQGKSQITGILDPENWLHSILTFLDPRLERYFYQMIYLNAKYVRNKSISEGKHLHILRKHLAPAVDNTSMGEIIAVKLHHHHQPNPQGQQLKGRELSLLCCQRGRKACWQHVHYQYLFW